MIKMKKILILPLLSTVIIILSFVNSKPKILIIGDSISIGYTPHVKASLSDRAIISHNEGNAQHTGKGLLHINEWLGDEDWDIIQFNWGIWDLCYRNPESNEFGNRDKKNGKVTYTVEEYASNLDSIVTIIKKKTHAKLIFVTTTYVPKDEPGRYESDVQKYNNAAKRIMKKQGVMVNDIYDASVTVHHENGLGSKNVHYTDEGYKKLGKLIFDFLKVQIE
jgi:lysophospholipase L1-like esterase